MAQTGRSAIGHGASTKNTAGREKWLARVPQYDVEWAALEHQWGMLAIHKAHLALMAVDNVEMEYQYDCAAVNKCITNVHQRLRKGDPHPQVHTDAASAYLCTFKIQQRGEKEKKALAEIARCIRDLTVVTILVHAGGHTDIDIFNDSLNAAFGGTVSNAVKAQIVHSYHHLLHQVSGKFSSECQKKGRCRPVRRPRDSGKSSGAFNGHRGRDAVGASSTLGAADSVPNASGAADASQFWTDRVREAAASDWPGGFRAAELKPTQEGQHQAQLIVKTDYGVAGSAGQPSTASRSSAAAICGAGGSPERLRLVQSYFVQLIAQLQLSTAEEQEL